MRCSPEPTIGVHGASFARGVEPHLRRADAQHTQRATHQRENDGVNANRSGAEHEHCVADLYVSAFDSM